MTSGNVDLEARTESSLTSLTREQVNAIIYSDKMGERMARDHPEITGQYERGDTLLEIGGRFAEEYGLCSDGIIKSSTTEALIRLLGQERYHEIAKQHQRDNGQARGIGTRDEGRGLFGMSEESKAVACKSGGEKTYSMGRGMFGLSEEEKRKNQRMGWEKALEVTGQVIFDGETRETEFGIMNEKDYIIECMKRGEGHEGTLEKVNSVFGNDRNRQSIRNQVYKARKAGELPKYDDRVYSGALRATEFGEVDEKNYVQRLKGEGLKWREIAEKVNSVFGNDRRFEGLRNMHSHWKKQEK